MKQLFFCWGWMLAVVVLASRDWFIALCGTIAYTGIAQYPQLPPLTDALKGLNYWAVMMMAVLFFWLIQRRGRFDIPRGWMFIFTAYMVVQVIIVLRTALDVEAFGVRATEGTGNLHYRTYTVKGFLVDTVYTPLKFMIGGFLLMDGARNRRRLVFGLGAVAVAGALFSLIINKSLPLESLRATGERLLEFRHRVNRETGFHPNDVAAYLGTSFWIVMAMLPFVFRRSRWLGLGACAVMGSMFLALLHTHSRGGYVGFVGTAVITCVARRSWRGLGVLFALCVATVFIFPSVPVRLLSGVGVRTVAGDQANDLNEISAGRNIIWAAALEGISESPIIGHGRYGYVMSSAIEHSNQEGGGEIHPHNAYLEALLDAGLFGAPAVLGPFVYVAVVSFWLIRRRPGDPILQLVGAGGLGAACTLMLQAVAGQHFVLSENLFFWMVAGLVVRATTLSPLRLRSRAPTSPGARPRTAVSVLGVPS